nr:D-alanyl-D-alanine carboxypeptidase [Clostridia bacterium]
MLFKYIKNISTKVIVLTFTVYFISTLFIISRAENYEWTVINNSDVIETNSQAEGENVDKTAKDELNLECESAILIEQNSGQVLYEKNMHEQLRPASVTKVMSILLIFEALESGKIKLDDKVPCSENAASMGGSQIWLDTREELSVNEMLKAIICVSANDCTVAMAEYMAGSESAFVDKMNERAKQLGMNDTTFKNCHGIDEDGHVTSSYDIALMSRELLTKHPDITNYTTIYMDTLRNGQSQLVNTNKLVRNYKGATGLKTGSTSLALFNLSASATRDDLSLIAVIMKAPTSAKRFSEAQRVLDYGFKNYEFKQFGKNGDVIGNVTVEKGIEKEVNAMLNGNCGVLLKKGSENNVVQNVNLPKKISAPVEKGQKIGQVTYTLDGKLLQTVDIISDKEVKKESLMNVVSYIYEKWFCLLR